MRANVQSQDERRKSPRQSAAAVRGVVVTLTWKSVAVVALTASIAGTVQVAPGVRRYN